MSASTLRWIHDGMLRPGWADTGAPCVFVFDNDWIRDDRLALKRVVFMYECVLEMPGVAVRRGSIIEELTAAAEACGVDTIETAKSPDPRIKRQVSGLERAGLSVRELYDPPFVDLGGEVDLKRFSRYWKKAQKQAFNATGR